MPWLARCHCGGSVRRSGVAVSTGSGNGSAWACARAELWGMARARAPLVADRSHQPGARSARVRPVGRPTCQLSPSRLTSSIHPLPVENVATRFDQGHRYGRCGADRLVALVQDDHVPSCVGLSDRKIVLATALAGNNIVAMPIIIAYQPHTGQRVACGVGDLADDVGWRPWTTGTGMRGIGLGRKDRQKTMGTRGCRVGRLACHRGGRCLCGREQGGCGGACGRERRRRFGGDWRLCRWDQGRRVCRQRGGRICGSRAWAVAVGVGVGGGEATLPTASVSAGGVGLGAWVGAGWQSTMRRAISARPSHR